jgi:hypothetical protein
MVDYGRLVARKVLGTPLSRFGTGKDVGRSGWLAELTHFMVGGHWTPWLEELIRYELIGVSRITSRDLCCEQTGLIEWRQVPLFRLLCLVIHNEDAYSRQQIIEGVWHHVQNKDDWFKKQRLEVRERIRANDLVPILEVIGQDALFFQRRTCEMTRDIRLALSWLWNIYFSGPYSRLHQLAYEMNGTEDTAEQKPGNLAA